MGKGWLIAALALVVVVAGGVGLFTKLTPAIETAPPKLTLILPENNAVENTLPIIFMWTGNKITNIYYIQIDNETSFTSPYVHENTAVADNSYFYTFSADGTYYWRVRAKDEAGNWGPWADNFKLDCQTSGGEQPEVENVDLSYLAEHMGEFENKMVRVTGTVSYPSPIGIPEFPKFWLNGVEVRASMGKILPSENSIVTVVGTVTKVGENFYVIYAESWTEAGWFRDRILIRIFVMIDHPDGFPYKLRDGTPFEVGVYKFYLQDNIPGTGAFELIDKIPLQMMNENEYYGEKVVNKINDALSVGYPSQHQNFIDGKACVEVNQDENEVTITVHYWETLMFLIMDPSEIVLTLDDLSGYTVSSEGPIPGFENSYYRTFVKTDHYNRVWSGVYVFLTTEEAEVFYDAEYNYYSQRENQGWEVRSLPETIGDQSFAFHNFLIEITNEGIYFRKANVVACVSLEGAAELSDAIRYARVMENRILERLSESGG